MERVEIMETTLGDMIVALIEEISQYVHEEKEVYKVVAFSLTHLLNNSSAASRRSQYWQ